MLPRAALTTLLLCVGICCANGWAVSFDEDSNDDWTSDTWAEEGEDASVKEWESSNSEVERLSDALEKSGASDQYTSEKWANLLESILFKYENRKDPVIDMNQKPTLKISAKFSAPEMSIELCGGLIYTLPKVDENLLLTGEKIPSASTRYEPKVYITDLHGECVKDGLYTMIWADRQVKHPTEGSFETPFIAWMVVNIPGGDISKGDVKLPYIPNGDSDDYQVFVYEQLDYIYDDFAISQYTEVENCVYQFRCNFKQASFVEAYGLRQRAVGYLSVIADPFSANLERTVSLMNGQEACVYLLDIVIPTELTRLGVNTDDETALKKAFKKYTSKYMSKAVIDDEQTQYLLKGQYRSLVNKLVNKFPTDLLIPNYVEFSYDIGFRYEADATSVYICGVRFDLPAVQRTVWFEDDKWDDGKRVELSPAETQNAPGVKIAERERLANAPPKDDIDFKDKLFTLMVVDRFDFGEELAHFSTPDTPYIVWMIVNIKGGDINTGDEVSYYDPWPETTSPHVFLYEQQGVIDDITMRKYTGIKCYSRNKCAFDQALFTWDYDLELVGAGRYDVTKDLYGDFYGVRQELYTPNQVCDTYLAAQKLKGGGDESPDKN